MSKEVISPELSTDDNVAAHCSVCRALIAEVASNRGREQKVSTLLLNTDSDLRGLAAIGIDTKRMAGQ